MEQYVGLDVSMEETSVCVLDQAGDAVFEGNVPSRPEPIAKILRRRAPSACWISNLDAVCRRLGSNLHETGSKCARAPNTAGVLCRHTLETLVRASGLRC